MSNWISWRNPAVVAVVAAMLAVAAIVSLLAASDLNEASDGQAIVSGLTQAAANIELAWYQAMGADALAATGQAPDEAQGFYDSAINLYNQNKAVLASVGIAEIDQAMAGSDQGLAGMTQAFAGTLALAGDGQIAEATANHLNASGAIYSQVDPAVEGLALVAQAADAKLQSKMDAGATKLRAISIIGLFVAAFGAAYAGWLAYTSRKEEATGAMAEESAQFEKAA
jgi:hypothetical protein